jgi:hypothetical protein
MFFVRVVVPVLQLFVHVDQPAQFWITQSLGQLCVLQSAVSSTYEQGMPPNVGFGFTRLRLLEPPSQLFEHEDQVVNSPSHSQSFGHGCVLHSWVSSVCGHASPPCLGVFGVCWRVRDCEPRPHDLVQLDQSESSSAHGVIPQSTGQKYVLHGSEA